jgi:dephospho-CoA kinase
VGNWPGKYVIGLTGNIATGKSVVRRMLEHLGAYTIDADTLAHRAIAKGAPGYQPVVETFGRYLLDANGEINRGRLGRLVFNDPQALKILEGIVHPLVGQAVDLLIKRAHQRVVVIEAIKLLEGKLHSKCDAIWVTYSPETIQRNRLMMVRAMTEEEALQRIRSQPPQEQKMTAATVVIKNTGSFEDTWKQVVKAWKVISPVSDTTPVITRTGGVGNLAVQRGRPRDSANISALITRLSNGLFQLSPQDVMAAFGEKAYLLLLADKQLVGLAGWQVENLVARTTELYLDPGITISQALKILVKEVERASQDLQCEASLLFLSPELDLGVQAWQEAALESQPSDTILLIRQLRQDRVLRPI